MESKVRQSAVIVGTLIVLLMVACGAPRSEAVPAFADDGAAARDTGADSELATDSEDGVVHVNGRTVDLRAHLTAYPFDRWPSIDLRSGRYFVKKRVDGGREELMLASFDPKKPGELDLEQATRISPRDFTKRNLWGAVWSPVTNRAVIKADEKNDEVLNLYELDPATGEERRLTDVAYIYDFALSPDGRSVACTTRSTSEETSQGHVVVVDLVERTSRVVYTDSPAIKMVWGSISWQPNGKGLLVPFMHDSLRKKRNLLYVPLGGGKARVLTDTKVTRTTMSALDWADDDHFLYEADAEETVGVFRGSLKTGKHTRVTAKDANVKSSGVIHDGGVAFVVAVTGNPLRSTLQLIHAATAEVAKSEDFDGSLYVYDSHADSVALKTISLTDPFSVIRIQMKGDAVSRSTMVGYPADVLAKVVHCDVEKVSFPTFDKPTVPGETDGKLHAYVLSPKRKLGPDKARALVLSFYGGTNYFSPAFQVLCDAGYHVMSPAPRGTSDFGTAFFTIGDGDWGGGETLDAFFAGEFLAKHLGLPADRIGIFGGSRGGYDTMRALTFPGQVNGVSVDFRFGFGISDYGISDIISAYEEGNIQGWYVKLTGGDPTRDAAKWRDRSPITHVAKLNVPLLLTHGDTDSRVPVAESRRFVEAAKALGKDVTYVELEGQGHGYKGVEANTKYFRAVLQFLGELK